MTQEEQKKIEKISKEFASGFDFGAIAGTGFLIVDPLSGYLNSIGYKNTLSQIPATEKHPQILVMTFEDGTQFLPGS